MRNKSNSQSMNVSTRWIQKLYSRHRSSGSIPILGKPGRPKNVITEEMVKTVQVIFEKFKCCAVFLEKIIDADGTRIPHNTLHTIPYTQYPTHNTLHTIPYTQYPTHNTLHTIPYTQYPTHDILRDKGLAESQPKKNKRRKWVRYERTYSNSMWRHTDWKLLDDGRGVCHKVLKESIAKYGRTAPILTDHGSQFYANKLEYKRRSATKFEKELVRLEIKHILARVNHPQTNGKLERFHGEIQRKQKWFETIEELID